MCGLIVSFDINFIVLFKTIKKSLNFNTKSNEKILVFKPSERLEIIIISFTSFTQNHFSNAII